MQSGRLIFLISSELIVNGNLLAIYNFFYSLAIFVLAGNLSSNGNGLKVIFLLDAQRNDALSDLTDSFALASVVTILPLYSRLVTWLLNRAFL